MMVRYNFTIMLCLLLAITIFLASTSALAATHGQPARSEMLIAGPYTIVMGLSDDPPQVEQDLVITISPRDAVSLSGSLIGQPGPGTDAAVVRKMLVPNTANPHILDGALRLPVRGAWTLLVKLNGPRGSGTASLDVIVAAPNAIPVWLGWLIGLLPLIGCFWLIWQQWSYRRTLVKVQQNG